MKFGCSFGIFLNSAYLICRITDISKCFSGSLGLRDNESRLYHEKENKCYLFKKCPRRHSKVGSWSCEGIIILLIYFLNCRKIIFTKKLVSFSKKYKDNSIRLAVLQRIPYLCCAHQLELFLVSRQN